MDNLLPKDKHTISINISASDMQKIRENQADSQLIDKIEAKREIAIMKEVFSAQGTTITDKIGNVIASWGEQTQTAAKEYKRYRLRHR